MIQTDSLQKQFYGLFYTLVILTSVLTNSVAQGAIITNDEIHGFYDPSLVHHIVSKGPLPTIVIGNPFGPETDFSLLKNITLPGYYPTTALSRITAKERDDGHLIMIFYPINSLSGLAACLSPPQQNTISGSNSFKKNLRLLIAFCYDKEVVSEAYIEMKRPSKPTDKDFKKAIAQLFSVLLPIQKPFLGGCQDFGRGNC